MLNIYQQHTQALREALDNIEEWHKQVAAVTRQLREAFNTGHKVLVAGNGGSATLAQHLSDEMVGRYIANRPAYPVIALTADSAIITCIGNDLGYEQVFSRQIEALGQEGDVFISYSTSGTSPNIIKAVGQARDQGLVTVAFTGQVGQLKDIVDYPVISPAKTTNRIQELDLHALHLICEAFEPDNLATEI